MTNKVYTSITEVYDLHTQVDKLGVIGVKTPSMRNVWNSYKGLIINFQKVKFLSCDVKLACASTLPVDPLQVGFEAGQQIDPRSLFDPILYKAVSNDSMSSIISNIYSPRSSATALDGDSVTYDDDVNIMPEVDDFAYDAKKIYYNFLANGRFKKAMPQQGLQMNALRPFVYPVATSVKLSPRYQSDFGLSADGSRYPPESDSIGANAATGVRLSSFSLRPQPMPSLETAFWDISKMFGNDPTSFIGGASIGAKINDALVSASDPDTNGAPPVFVGVIITPPARDSGSVLYYRLVVTWHLVFHQLRPLNEIQSLGQIVASADTAYYTDYDAVAQAMTTRASAVDTMDMELEPVMTKVY